MDTADRQAQQSSSSDPPVRRVICILGAPRTGTHLLNSILCESPSVLPMLTESWPVVLMLEACERTLQHLARFPGMHFDRPAEVRKLYGALLRDFVEHLCGKYGCEVCVLRSPGLSPTSRLLRELLRDAGLEAQAIWMVRDPRDVVVSMREWSARRVQRGFSSLPARGAGAGAENGDRLRALAEWYRDSYRDLIASDFGAGDEAVMCLRYEDLVRDPHASGQRISQFTGIPLQRPESGEGWRTAQIDFRPQESRIGVAVTDLFGQPVSAASVGKWREALSDEEAGQVLEITKDVVERFYPEPARAPAGGG